MSIEVLDEFPYAVFIRTIFGSKRIVGFLSDQFRERNEFHGGYAGID